MAGRAVCSTPEEAAKYDWFCEMHRAALAISTIRRVRQVVSDTQLISEFEVSAGSIPFVSKLLGGYSGGLPLTIDGAIVSTADIVAKEEGSWSLLMDSVEVKGSNIPGLRQALDSGLKLPTRALGTLLEENLNGYSNPSPQFRTTYLDSELRIGRDQDGKIFVYTKVSDSCIPKNYDTVPADLGIGSLIDGLRAVFL